MSGCCKLAAIIFLALYVYSTLLTIQNFPLYLRTAPGYHEGELEFHHTVHTAIDVIEEKSELQYRFIYMYRASLVFLLCSFSCRYIKRIH